MKAVETSQPSDFLFGKVTSTSPLKVMVEQKLTLGSAQLVLTRNVTDYTVPISINWNTESVENHSHEYSGTDGGGDFHTGRTETSGTHNHQIVSDKSKTITIHNGLQVGEEVILQKKKGGQKYLIVDRAVNDE